MNKFTRGEISVFKEEYTDHPDGNYRSGGNYRIIIIDQYGDKHHFKTGIRPEEAAQAAIAFFWKFIQINPEGGDIKAPPEVQDLIPSKYISFPKGAAATFQDSFSEEY